MSCLPLVEQVGNRAWDLYSNTYLVNQDAPPEFRLLVAAITAVQQALKELDERLQSPSCSLDLYNVQILCRALDRTLDVTSKLVHRLRRMVGPAAAGDAATLPQKLWGAVKWQAEKRTVVDLAGRLTLHTNAVNLQLMTAANESVAKVQSILDAVVDSVELREDRAQAIRRWRTIQRTPVELGTGVDVVAPVELDSVEVRLPPPDAPASPEPEYEEGLIPVDSEETRALDQFWAEEKIVVGQIVAAASNWLLENGIQPSDKVVRAGTTLGRRDRIRAYDREPPTRNVPGDEDKFALTLQDLDPTLYTVADLLAPSGFGCGAKASQAFRMEASQNYGTPDWPKTSKHWLKLAAWWLTKSRLLKKEIGHATHQSCIDLSKAAWIMSEMLPAGAALEAESKFVHNKLWTLLKTEIQALRRDGSVRFAPFAVEVESFRILEPTQPEERGPWLLPEREDWVTQNLLRDETSYSFRALVSVDFGVVMPTQCAPESDKNYLLTMTLQPEEHRVTIAVCNQLGHLDAVNMLGGQYFPLVSETDVSLWFQLEFRKRAMYVGFSSLEAAVPFWVQRNLLRRELLERPTALFSITAEKVRYLTPSNTLLSVGPAKLKLMEMRRAEDENCRYREIEVENHFVTTEMPLHVIKIIENAVRVTLCWPSFNKPQEIKTQKNSQRRPIKEVDGEMFSLSPAMQERVKASMRRCFDVDFAEINDRLCDMELSTRTDRMLDVVFRSVEDAKLFIQHVGGTTAWSSTETHIFRRLSSTIEVHLFREIDNTARLCYVESGVYCNFFLDPMTTYFLAPDLSLSIWCLIWSPSGNTARNEAHYRQEAHDLSLFGQADTSAFLSAMFPKQRLTYLPISHLSAEQPSRINFLPGNVVVTAKIAAVVLAVVPNLKGENSGLRIGLRVVAFGELAPHSGIVAGIAARKLICDVPFEYTFKRLPPSKKSPDSPELKITFRNAKNHVMLSFTRDKKVRAAFPDMYTKRMEGGNVEFRVALSSWVNAMRAMGTPAADVEAGRKEGMGVSGRLWTLPEQSWDKELVQ